ncbi:hypothetical protein K491DRAFT_594607 [Lophiostoma macrostomum CBS 122681]|uniref:Uncharacterized protein n=1 Tax=Lophiostoma macrostomum CBS 122681 TaxID=1314788 RepID=A0A6A6TEE2_9PLEO|nr:hypothetical protein K491DRAFT_594607 [Lophiostoma macrostomum CBS 122681]
MAPLDPNAVSKSNALPVAILATQAATVAALTVYLGRNIRRAARALPPTTGTRAQEPVRRRNVAIFSALAFLSLASVTTFSVAWRVLSYFEWAEKDIHEAPGSLWTGWYGTGDEGVGRWRLGDWWSDTDLATDTDIVAVASPEGLLYTGQHLVGLATSAMFMGIEGRRRNLPSKTIAAFILLGGIGSLGFALNLFFVTMLFTPFAVHDDASPRHDALFTPRPSVFYVPAIATLFVINYLPTLLTRESNVILLRVSYLAMPLVLALAPQIVPVVLGRQHTSKTAAHRSFVRAFHFLGIAALFLQLRMGFTTLMVNTPQRHYVVWDRLQHAIGRQPENRFLQGLNITAQRLKNVSGHPAISLLASDVAFTATGLLVWTFVRQLEIGDILENSWLSFLAPSRPERHVAFKEHIEETVHKVEGDEALPAITPRKRGRPKKNAPNDVDHTVSPPAGALRRSTRRRARSDIDSDAEDAYEPTTQTRRAVEETETDGAPVEEDFIAGGESTALALFLFFTGGLGQLAAGSLGAEVTRSE